MYGRHRTDQMVIQNVDESVDTILLGVKYFTYRYLDTEL